MPSERFSHSKYLIRRKFFRLFGGAFYVDGPNGEMLMYGEMKAFKLREDIRVYTDLNKTQEVLTIKARKIIDFSSAYDVTDPATGESVGALKRRGWKSMLKDEWVIMSAEGQDVGLIQEDRLALALIRRLVPMANLIPQLFRADIGGKKVCEYRQLFNLFLLKLDTDFTSDTEGLLDRRLGIAAGILLCAIERKQN
jgi:hypothetical protein